jgi:hypothetical protein
MLKDHKPKKIALPILLLLLSSAILFACSPDFPETTATQSAATSPELSADPSATPKIETQVPTPIIAQRLVVLIAAPGADPALTEQLSLTLSELAAVAGLYFELRPSFTLDDSTAEIKLLVALPPDPGLAALAQSSPATQFLGITIPGLEPGTNLNVIHDQEARPDMVGFLAGYLAAVATPEWRVGVISSSDTSQGVEQRQGFINGAVFFCGLCRQTYPPFNTYPMYAEAPAGASPPEWLALADTLIDSAVGSAYIAPGIGDESLIEYLTAAGINIISTTTPLPGFEEYWIASITADFSAAIRSIWPNLMADQGDLVLSAPLTITHINPDLFSPGRQRLVEKMLDELSDGFIDTGVATVPDSQ